MIQIKRVYDDPDSGDGYRVLVDHVWPRGISKDKAKLDEWAKEVAPSDTLRKWFDHDPDKFTEFKKKFTKELDDNTSVDELVKTLKKHKKATLVYAAKDEKHNNAVALRDYLKKKV